MSIIILFRDPRIIKMIHLIPRLTVHCLLMVAQIFTDDDVEETLSEKWPVMLFVLSSSVVTFFITELCKWQEIK